MRALFLFFALWEAHEIGHIIAWRIYGVKAKGIMLNFWKPLGLGVVFDSDRTMLPINQQIKATMAGPISSVLIGMLALPIDPVFAKCSIFFGALNLIPFKGSDGWTIAKTSGKEFV